MMVAYGNGETILLVDDNDSVRRAIASILELGHYTVLQAANGHQALQLSAQHHGNLHLLLTDLVMPRISGKDLALQVTQTHPEAKVLYMSGYLEEDVKPISEPNGASFVQKPISAVALLAKINQI